MSQESPFGRQVIVEMTDYTSSTLTDDNSLLSLIRGGMIDHDSILTLLGEAVREAKPILAATIHRSISLDLDRFMELVDRDCQMIKETVPPDYRGPSMLSVVDLLAIDPIVYQPLTQMFDDAYLYPSVPRVRWNQDFASLSKLLPSFPRNRTLNNAMAKCIASDLVIATRCPQDHIKFLDIFSSPFGGVYREMIKKAIETSQPQPGPLAEATKAILTNRVLHGKVSFALEYLLW